MDKNEYAQHGDIVIEDTGYGFRVIPENMKNTQKIIDIKDILVYNTGNKLYIAD